MRFNFKKRLKKLLFKIDYKFLNNKSNSTAFELEESNELYEYFLKQKDKEIDKWHNYFPIYYKHFAKFKNSPVNILEIGVDKGGSLKMWKEFFGDKAQIFGVDILEDCKKYQDIENGIHIIIGDQSDPRFWQKTIPTLPKIDILIDDGGHMTKQQIVTFNECYDKISDDGIYLVEDLHTNYWKAFVDTKVTFIDFAKKHIDALNAWYKVPLQYNIVPDEKFKVPIFTNITHSITFYNSIIVFEKQKINAPFSERR